MPTLPENQLRPAVVGDSADTRIVELTGIDNIADVSEWQGWVWRSGVARAAIPVALADADANTVTVDLGTWLADAATPGEWWFEIEADGVTWPGSRRPARLTVRNQAPPP